MSYDHGVDIVKRYDCDLIPTCQSIFPDKTNWCSEYRHNNLPKGVMLGPVARPPYVGTTFEKLQELAKSITQKSNIDETGIIDEVMEDEDPDIIRCLDCKKELPYPGYGRKPTYCDAKCRQRALRKRAK